MITQGAQTFAQVFGVLIGQTAVELDIGVGGKAAEFQVDKGRVTSFSGAVTNSQKAFGPSRLATRG